MDMKIMCRFILLACLIVLLAAPAASAQAKVKPKLAILPFTLNGAGDLGYLKEGVRTMLASRIAARAEVVVLGRAAVEKVVAGKAGSDPAAAAKSLAADLVLSGSITALGDSVSIDARLLTMATNDSAGFFGVAENQSGIIGVVDQLASDITAHISGEARQARSADQAASAPQPSAEPVGAPDQSLHPDRMFKSPVSVPAPVKVPVPVLPTAGPGPGISAVSAARPPLSATRSQFLDMEVQVMDVGDVFGEGQGQIVVAEKQKITVFRQEGNRLVKAGEAPAAPRHVRIIALNLADLNANGRAEIYISAISDNNPFSYAVEWDGQNFVKLFDKQRHYLRPLLLPGKGWILYGQQADNDAPVKPGIYVADSSTGSLLTDEKLAVAESVNLYEFVMGDFTGDGRLETAVQTEDDDLLLYNLEGDLLWQGSGNYGYTKRFIGAPYAGNHDQQTLQVPTRLIAADLNGDGRQELVAMNNPSGTGALLKTIGSFVGGSIKVMDWNGVTFTDLWSTGEIGSYVASFQVKVAEPRLYFAMVSKKSGIFFNALQSVVASYSLAEIGVPRP